MRARSALDRDDVSRCDFERADSKSNLPAFEADGVDERASFRVRTDRRAVRAFRADLDVIATRGDLEVLEIDRDIARCMFAEGKRLHLVARVVDENDVRARRVTIEVRGKALAGDRRDLELIDV